MSEKVLMDLRWFEDVLILLEERNMTRAAERRNITQPAFSRRIRSFEYWLGTPLLERKVNRVKFNPSLIANESEIKLLIHRIQEFRHKINTFQPERSHISVATQHALIFSTFPDIAAVSLKKIPNLDFRLRAGNRGECISLFLRGDASVLLCHEGEDYTPMPFDDTIIRDEWGTDRLVPAVGGSLRFTRNNAGHIPDDTPAIVYPEQSYFGELLAASNKKFSTKSKTANPVCETAFSSGIKEMVEKGLGVAWLPLSMIYREIEDGRLVNLNNSYGSLLLKIVFYTSSTNDISRTVRKVWSRG